MSSTSTKSVRWATTTLMVVTLLSGCRTDEHPSSRSTNANSFAVASDFQRLLREHGSITFRSWNGKAYRMDSDTELTFYSDLSAHMFEWGVGLGSYRGSWRLNSNGSLSTQFNHYGDEWPVLTLFKDGETLMLRPQDPDVGFVLGNRGGATFPEKGSYWPFRMLSGVEEKRVLDMIKERAE